MIPRSGLSVMLSGRKGRRKSVKIVIGIGIVLMALIIMVAREALMAVEMPLSWNETTGEYEKCSDCSWTCDDDYSFYGEPGPGCRECPFCYKPGKSSQK